MATGGHAPAPTSLLRYFEYAHLRSGTLRDVSRRFAELAYEVDELLPGGAEKTVALRKLLEAKDAAVRSALDIVDPLDGQSRAALEKLDEQRP
jgi:hypothetical protein